MEEKIEKKSTWKAGNIPIAVVLITLNEEHNLEGVLDNVKDWAQEVFIVDSFSQDRTVDIALDHGVHIIQRKFRGFGDQWNYALNELPITAKWTMKLDPDERLSDEIKKNIFDAIQSGLYDGLEFNRRWWLMGTPLPIWDTVLRVWRTGKCEFSDVSVNEHPMVDGDVKLINGVMEHLDSPNLHHWIQKQNEYSSSEAVASYSKPELSVKPRLLGSSLERRMWLKHHFYKIPGRYQLLFLYFLIYRGLWKAGKVGYHSAQLWTDVYRWKELKTLEMKISGQMSKEIIHGPGKPDSRVKQAIK
ncbi:MAG: glycosyltransferase family 2 protein [Pseudomonadota bacterium]|nr:glycosyltransferase family 2 protein [Pseudomonadota bacterium]